MTTTPEPRSTRTTVRRGKNRADYSDDGMRQILDQGMLAHMAVNTPDGPIVLPMIYGVEGDEMFIHGAVANAMMRQSRSIEVCVTVSIVDGFVLSRTPFSNSMNYRSVVVRGEATLISDPQKKLAALKVINDHMFESWDQARPPSEAEVKATMVLSVPLGEMSGKVRTGGPNDSDEDIALDIWAGVVPLTTSWGEAQPADNLRSGIPVPPVVSDLNGVDAHR